MVILLDAAKANGIEAWIGDVCAGNVCKFTLSGSPKVTFFKTSICDLSRSA